jgi:hypothetical protein
VTQIFIDGEPVYNAVEVITSTPPVLSKVRVAQVLILFSV